MDSNTKVANIPTWEKRWREPKGTGSGIPERNRMMAEIQELRELLKYQEMVVDPRFLKYVQRVVRTADHKVEVHFSPGNADDFEELIRGSQVGLGFSLLDVQPEETDRHLYSVRQLHHANSTGRVEGLEEALDIVKAFAQDVFGFIEEDNPMLPTIQSIERRIVFASSEIPSE